MTYDVMRLYRHLREVMVWMHHSLLGALGIQSTPATERVLREVARQLLPRIPGTPWALQEISRAGEEDLTLDSLQAARA